LEETHVNLNQGAESAISYLMARLTVEKYNNTERIYGNRDMVGSEVKSMIEQDIFSQVKENSSNITSYFFVADTSGITRKMLK
jgi:hypothetical protein